MAEQKPRRGRPPKISREDIANKALELGLNRATIRNVAGELGVSVMGIYHHVRNVDELIDLALSRELGSLLGPIDRMVTFEDVLMDVGQRYYALLADHPEMLSRLVSHATNPQRTGRYYEAVLACAARHGISEEEASHAMRCVLMVAAGAAAMAERKDSLGEDSFRSLLERSISANPDRPMPHVKALLRTTEAQQWDPMEGVRLVIIGLRATLGDRLTDGVIFMPDLSPV